MMNRVVSILVGVSMLVAQSVGLPHSHSAHGEAEPAGHGLTPHVHLTHHSSHHHHHGETSQHSHRHSARHHHHSDPVAETSGGSHDSDAVYLPLAMLPSNAGPQRTGPEADFSGWVNDLDAAAASSRVAQLFVTAWHLPPPRPRLNCPLFLETHALLL